MNQRSWLAPYLRLGLVALLSHEPQEIDKAVQTEFFVTDTGKKVNTFFFWTLKVCYLNNSNLLFVINIVSSKLHLNCLEQVVKILAWIIVTEDFVQKLLAWSRKLLSILACQWSFKVMQQASELFLEWLAICK